jgi:myosin heavy subunit
MKIRQEGYDVGIPHSTFCKRYGYLLPRKEILQGKGKDIAYLHDYILRNLDKIDELNNESKGGDCQVGKSKIFMREAFREKLELFIQKKAATRTATYLRGAKQRCAFLKLCRAVISLQR